MRLALSFYKTIEAKINKLIKDQAIKELPIPIEHIANTFGAAVMSYELGDEVSGILVIGPNNTGTIGFNASQSRGRQRFTIAHELGHFVLHSDATRELFVDRDFIVKFRSKADYTATERRQESEANAFAAAILMPEPFISKELQNVKYQDLAENELIEELARAFEVSSIAMTYRLKDLNILA